MRRLQITRRAFHEWLAGNQDLTFKRASSCDCPLAIFLGSGCDREVSVDVDITMVDGETFENPPWMLSFIQRVDDRQGEIDGARALKLLIR